MLYGLIKNPWSLVLVLALSPSAAQAAAPLPHGFTPFPYETTLEAVDNLHALTLPASNLYALHLDHCVPWRQAYRDKALPDWLERELQGSLARIPQTHTVYLAVTPGNLERTGLAPACGSQSGSTESPPPQFSQGGFAAPETKVAYLNYVRRLVETFQPRFLNIGIEMNQLSLHDPQTWPDYAELYRHVYQGIKAEYPQIQVGMSFVLQTLLLPRVAQQVMPELELGDYVGLSFYPYASEFGEVMGTPPLPTGIDQWRQPLAWVRALTDKPLAITETGYLSEPLELVDYGLSFDGGEAEQAAYLRDLVQIANLDRYAFVIWFVAIDYDRLFASLADPPPWKKIWMHTGLLDSQLNPKPAWREWQAFAFTTADNAALPPVDEDPITDTDSSTDPLLGELDFNSVTELFQCLGGTVALDEAAPAGDTGSMVWSYEYSPDWLFCIRNLESEGLTGASQLILYGRSDRAAPLYLRIDEADGESYYQLLWLDEQWRNTAVALTELWVDEATRVDGRLDPEQITAIAIIDAGGIEGETGQRSIWLAKLGFSL